MSDHTCPECGMYRTELLGHMSGCEACYEFLQELGGNDAYDEWKAQFEEEKTTGSTSGKSALEIMGEANEKARNGEDGYTTH